MGIDTISHTAIPRKHWYVFEPSLKLAAQSLTAHLAAVSKLPT